MSVRMRHTRSHTANRRSHHALKQRALVRDAQSGALRLPHRLDETTGSYRGRQFFTPKAKEPKTAASAHASSTRARKAAADEAKPAEARAAEIAAKTAARPKARSGMGGGV